MEAASVHHLPRQAGINADGEVDPDLPATLPECWQRIRRLEAENGQLAEDLETTTLSWRSAKGEAKKYRRRLLEVRQEEQDADTVREVLRYWREKCAPRAEIVEGDDRWEKVRDRLGLSDTKRTTRIDDRGGAGYTVAELKQVVDGALTSEWHCGKNDKGKTYLDAGSIFGTSKRVRDHIARAVEAEDARIEARLETFAADHPASAFALVHGAIVRERQVDQLKVLAPCAFEPKPSELRDTSFEEYPVRETGG